MLGVVVDSFGPLQRPVRRGPIWKLTSSGSRISSSSSSSSQDDEDASTIQERLMHFGMAWKQTSKPLADLTRVPGCVATVYVWAEVEDTTNTVRIQGTSDAIVSRGLLAVLSEYLHSKSLSQVLELDPFHIADALGVRPALSQGRNDGLANMLQIIQQQLRHGGDQEELEETKSPPKSSEKPTVALLLSGGVDSSVALRLLQQDGYEVTAFYLKIWLQDETAHLGECPWEDDVHMCEQVCDQADVPLKIISLQDEYHERVMQHTLQEASQGRTPNPDILCNSRVKFGCFLDYIGDDEFDYIASGHYAQLVRSNTDGDNNNNDGAAVKLVRAPDPVKDQSYFLCALQQSQLQKLLFPIGHLEKVQVRELAETFQLPNRNRPDSQGLCFLGKVKFRDFLQLHLGERQGDILDAVTGECIGRHDGVWYHTVGQRKGIGKSLNPLATARGPWYVVAKDPAENLVYCSNQYDEEVFCQARSEFHVENIHWIADGLVAPKGESKTHRLWLKIRHGPRLVRGTLELLDGTDEGIIQLDEKDGGLAPGQYAVFYTEDAECLGGGIISERHWAKFLLENQSRVTAENMTLTT
jgi:tRNA (5-methylaminomethyl-2-thiouridylate)-methyltransferase